MKLGRFKNHAVSNAWQAGLIAAACGLAVTGLSCRMLWISHLEEADRQLKLAGAALQNGESPFDQKLPSGFLSGEPAGFHLIALLKPDGTQVFDDASWLKEDRAPLEAGGRFKTKQVQGRVWRIMGLREKGWSIRLAMDIGEVFQEVGVLAAKAALLTLVASLAAASLAWCRFSSFSRKIRMLSTGLQSSRTFLPDAGDPEELLELKKALQELNQSLEASQRFAADAGHELRTPLSIIQGTIGAAFLGPAMSEEVLSDFLESLLVQCRRLRVTLDALHLLARADAGSVPLQLERFDLANLVQELLDDLGAESESKELQIHAVLTSCMIEADRGLLRLALWNLLLNAVRHNFDLLGRIAVTIHQSPEAAGCAVLVENTGAPLAEDEHSVIFERFQRGRSARQNGVAGQGLGLSLARACLQAQGGSLSLERSDQRGTLMKAWLPPKLQIRHESDSPAVIKAGEFTG